MIVRAFGALLMLAPLGVMAETLNTTQILQRSYQSNCLDWKVVGVCLWLHCKYGRCRVNTTIRVSHKLPDLVFTAYDHPGQTPWTEMRLLPDLFDIGGGSFPIIDSQTSSSLRFKEVDAIGHPLPLQRKLFNVPYLCRSQAKPLFPYYRSVQDILEWRNNGIESLRVESVTPGLREIGSWPGNSWGAIYPRNGFVMQSDDAKAAAVTVQRAADIVTQPDQVRVYVPFGYTGHRRVQHGDSKASTATACANSGGIWQTSKGPAADPNCARDQTVQECLKTPAARLSNTRGRCRQQTQMAWMPAINERNASWQMISPKTQSRCETFGSMANWSSGKTSRDGGYAWNLWRPYECCAPGKGKFIGYKTF